MENGRVSILNWLNFVRRTIMWFEQTRVDPMTRWSTNLLDEYHVDYGVTLTLLHAWKIFSETPNESKWEYQNLIIQEVKSLKDLCHRSSPRSTSKSAKRGFNLKNFVDKEGDMRKVQQMGKDKAKQENMASSSIPSATSAPGGD
nr:hypothetical protein [Tanacetum cinerariifolium]